MRKVIQRLGVAAVGCIAVAAGFAWGFAAHRNHVFPYWWLKPLARAAGLARIPPEAKVPRHELWPERETRRERLETLQALPYVAGTADPHPERRGVILHRPELADAGLNLYAPATEPAAYLVDMEGRVVHRWSYGTAPWQHVELLPDGGLLASVADRELLRLDRRSNLVWRRRTRFHHDFHVGADGTIRALVRHDERVPAVHPEVDSVVDSLLVLSSDGEVLREVSLLDAVLRSPYAFLLPRVAERELDREEGAIDLLHTNHVEVVEGTAAGGSGPFSPGDLVVSFRTLSLVAVLDGESLAVLWAWGPNNLLFPHHPTLLPGGHLLVFDNGIERSRVVEVDPAAQAIVWSYSADDLFTRTRGSAQRLPGGNTLITESDTGYVFEVTPEGERVWVFAAPHDTPDGERAAIWRMHRYPPGTAGF